MNQIRNLVRENENKEQIEEWEPTSQQPFKPYPQCFYELGWKEATSGHPVVPWELSMTLPQQKGLLTAGMTVSDVWQGKLEETSKSVAIQVLEDSIFGSAPPQDIDITPPDVTVIFRRGKKDLSEQLHQLIEAKGLKIPRGRVMELRLLDKIVVSAGLFGGFSLLLLGGVFGLGFFSWMGVACLATSLVHILTNRFYPV